MSDRRTVELGLPDMTDAEMEDAAAAGVRHVREQRQRKAAAVAGVMPALSPDLSKPRSTADGPGSDVGWEPFEDATVVDASKQIPDVVLPAFAWKARLSIVSSEPKAGKSTALAQAILCSLNGEAFADWHMPPQDGPIAIVTEEPLGLLAGRLRLYGLVNDRHVGRVWVASPRQGIDRLLASFVRQRPSLIIVDSLTSWAVQTASDTMNDAVSMRRMVDQFRPLADEGAAVVFVHHGRKSDGVLRDSVDLAASVDMLITFDPINAEQQLCSRATTRFRRLTYTGRWPADNVVLDFKTETSRYVVDEGRTDVARSGV